jgi:apolipoprotein N-acyltransferase
MIIQIADIGGTYGVSFLIVLVNSAIAALLYAGFANLISSRRAVPNPFLKQARLPLITAILFMLVLFYGYVQTSRPVEGQALKISVIQGNIEQSKKWDKKYAPVIMQIYADLTQTASAQTPDLIVWPETATPGAINQDPRLYEGVRKIATEANTPILLGSAQVQKFKVERSQVKGVKYLNSAYLIFPNGDKTKDQRYDKIRLLPFGEYLPYKKTIPWSSINIPEVDYYLPGKTFTIFNLDAHQFGVTVCWENIFPDIVRQFVKEGARFIINLTNEAWFGESAAPYQFLSMSVLRAVENKIYIIRCANTGISCFIDPQGRIVGRVKDSSGRDIFVRGILTANVVPQNHKTLYMQYGDWFVGLNLFGMLLTLLASFFKKWKYRSSHSSIR